MDIIGPPYNEERQCTFYRELEWNAVPVDRIHYSNKRPSSLSSSSSASSSSSSSSLSSRSSGSNNSVTNSDHKNNLFSSSPTSSSSSMTRLFNHLGLLSGDSSSSPPLPPLYEKFLLVQDPQLDCVCSPRVYQGLPVILNGSKSVVPYNLVAQQLLLSKSTLEQQQQQQRQQQQSLPHASKLTSVVNN